MWQWKCTDKAPILLPSVRKSLTGTIKINEQMNNELINYKIIAVATWIESFIYISHAAFEENL